MIFEGTHTDYPMITPLNTCMMEVDAAQQMQGEVMTSHGLGQQKARHIRRSHVPK